MNAVIISIGNELLSGHENTNASWIAKSLTLNGINVSKIYSISDEKGEIMSTIDMALKTADIVLSTGGLGPTKDDITKSSLCKYFNCDIVFCESAYKNIENIFKTRGLPVTSINKKQAEIPEKANAIPNVLGTAPGLWFEIESKSFIAMPGVPFEMKAMFEDFIVPKLKIKYRLPSIVSRTILTQGIGESFLSDIISDWENSIPDYIKLAYLPSPGIVKLRLTGSNESKELLERKIDDLTAELQQIIPDYIYGFDNQKLEDIIGGLLVEQNASVSTAESCTGGYLSHLITSCAGSSEYFKGTVVAYSNEVKIKVLNIEQGILDQYGAVSEQVVKAMATNVRTLMNTDYGVAVTGIAGPGGGTEYKSVGTVWIAVSCKDNIEAKQFLFGENRINNISKSAITALNMLRKEILKNKV